MMTSSLVWKEQKMDDLKSGSFDQIRLRKLSGMLVVSHVLVELESILPGIDHIAPSKTGLPSQATPRLQVFHLSYSDED